MFARAPAEGYNTARDNHVGGVVFEVCRMRRCLSAIHSEQRQQVVWQNMTPFGQDNHVGGAAFEVYQIR